MFEQLHLWRLRRQLRRKIQDSQELFLRDVVGLAKPANVHVEPTPDLNQLKEMVSYLQKKGFFYDGSISGGLAAFYHQSDFFPSFKQQRVFSTPPPLDIELSQWPTMKVVWGAEIQPPLDEQEGREAVLLRLEHWMEDITRAVELYWQLRKEAGVRAQSQKLKAFLASTEQSSSL